MVNGESWKALPPPPAFTLHHDAWGRLVFVDARGKEHVGCEPVRGFPLTDAQHFISICDSHGRELACITKVEELPKEVRDVLVDDLARREFVPIIEVIEKLSKNSDPTEWTVLTDRGRTTFLVNSDEDVRRLGRTRVMIVDRHSIRYLVPDTRKLDPASRRLLERFV